MSNDSYLMSILKQPKKVNEEDKKKFIEYAERQFSQNDRYLSKRELSKEQL